MSETFTYKTETNTVEIVDTFAEMFPMWACRVLVTADTEKWAMTGANVATGLATSVIMSPAEAGIEGALVSEKTPDSRIGVHIQVYNRNRFDLRNQMILRIGQCLMTCPTVSVYDGLPGSKRRLKVGKSLRLFGDGFQKKSVIADRRVWKIPVMEGEFIVEDRFGAIEAIAGGNIIMLAKDKASGLEAADKAASAIRLSGCRVIMPFPGGICRSGSKVGSLKYKLKASTNHLFCPTLRNLIDGSLVPEDASCVYEIVINGLTLEGVRRAMGEGVRAAADIPGILRITAGNYGGKIGPYRVFLREALNTTH